MLIRQDLAFSNHYFTIRWDRQAKVWFIPKSSIPGLAANATSIDELVKKARSMASDLLASENQRGEE